MVRDTFGEAGTPDQNRDREGADGLRGCPIRLTGTARLGVGGNTSPRLSVASPLQPTACLEPCGKWRNSSLMTNEALTPSLPPHPSPVTV